jgi:predicted nucleotidyltransferase
MDDLALPPEVAHALAGFVDAARDALGEDLVSAILFGSAAEGRLRATSDVNVVLVLAAFDPPRVDRLRESLRLARSTLGLEAMLILESELDDAAEAFAVKFADIVARHRVLAGRDVVATLRPPPGALRQRLRQILLNFVLRAREQYALASLREEQLAVVVADCAGPLRSAAAALLLLEGRPALPPREALQAVAAGIGPGKWEAALALMSRAREERRLQPGEAARALLSLIGLGSAMRAHALRIGAE